MRRFIHLYILAGLSSLRLFFRFYAVFLDRTDKDFLKNMPTTGVEEFMTYFRKSYELKAGVVMQVALCLLLVLLVMTWVFVVKKRLAQASYSYIAYLVTSVVLDVYQYVGSYLLFREYGTSSLRQFYIVTAGVYMLYPFFFVLFFSITMYFLLRRPTGER